LTLQAARCDVPANPEQEAFMTRRHDILALGNAIVDLIAVTDDDFLAKHKLHKGARTAQRRRAASCW
jgi:hypothetical protein